MGERADEVVLARLRPHVLNYVGHLLYFAVVVALGVTLLALIESIRGWIALFMLLALLLGALSLWLRRVTTRYTITNRRVVERHGLIARSENEVDVRDIRLLAVRQSFLERLAGIGTLEVGTAAEAGIEITLSGVRDPAGLKELIARQRT